MHGAIAETTQSDLIVFVNRVLCQLCVFAVNRAVMSRHCLESIHKEINSPQRRRERKVVVCFR